MKQQITKAINYINLGSFLYLTASSIFQVGHQRIGFYLFFISYFIEFILEKKWLNIFLDKKRIYFIILAIFFLLAFIYHPFENSSKYFVPLIARRFALFGFAIVGFFGVNEKFKINYILNTLIITSTLVSLYLIFFRIGLYEFIVNPLRSEAFKDTRILIVNSHLTYNLYLNISLISVWYIMTRSWRRMAIWKNGLYVGALFVIFGILSISEGRSGFITAILLMISFIFHELWKRKRVVGIVLGLLIPFVLIGLVSQHKRMTESAIKTEPRIFLLESAFTKIQEKPIFGYGMSAAQEQFDIERDKNDTINYKKTWPNERILHSQSQYSQTTLEFGVIGLLLLLILYSYPILLAENKKRLFAFYLLFTFSFMSLFDVVITGVNYATLFGISILLILTIRNNVELNNTEDEVDEKETKIIIRRRNKRMSHLK